MYSRIIKIRNGLVLLVLLCSAQFVSAQESYPTQAFPFDPMIHDFRDIKSEGMDFYNGLIETYGYEAVAQEGSPYVQFMKFIQEWEPKLAQVDYDFKAYFESQGRIDESGRTRETRGSQQPVCDWEELGPIVPTHHYSTYKIEGMGHTEFIRIAKHDPNKMLAGSIFGGLFYSSDAGNTWSGVSDNWAVGGCAWADFSEDHPGVIIAAQSLEQNNATGKSLGTTVNGGVMISYDYGQNWQKLISTNIISPWARINKVIFDPNNGNAIYVAMTGGIYRYSNIFSPDQSIYFSHEYDFDIPGQFEQTEVVDIEGLLNWSLFPSGPFFAVTVHGADVSGGSAVLENRAYVSTNAGNTFTEVFTGIGQKSASTFELSPYALGLVDPFIHFCAQVGSTKSIWTLSLTNLAVETQLFQTSDFSNFGNCFAFGVSPLSGKKMVFSQSIGLFGTVNGFTTSTNAMSNIGLHDDKEFFLWHPVNPNELWVCTHGGVERSLDNGVTWTDMSYGLGTANVMTFDDSPVDPSKMLMALEHGGAVYLTNSYYQNNDQHHWESMLFGDGVGALIIEEGDLNFYFASAQSPSSVKYQTTYGNYGVSAGGTYNNVEVFNAWFEESTDRTKVYTPGKSLFGNNVEVYRTELVPNTAPTAQAISMFSFAPGIGSDYNIRRVYSSDIDENMLFASGTAGGYEKLLYTDQAASSSLGTLISSWEEIVMPYAVGGLTNVGIVDVESSRYIKGRYYILTSGVYTWLTNPVATNMVYMLQFDNQGNYTLTDITGDLPNTTPGGIHDVAMVVEKGTHEGIYIATHSGVYHLHGDEIDDASYNWIEIGNGLPNIKKNGIKANYTINKLRVGTNGRGMWEGCLACPEDGYLVFTSPHSVGYEFHEVQDYITSNTLVYPNATIKYRAGNEITLTPGFKAYSNSDFHAFIHSCLPNGGNSFKSVQNDPWTGVSESIQDTRSDILNQEEIGQSGDLVTIYPNPSANEFNLNLESLEEGTEADIIITDLSGKVIRQFKTTFTNERVVVEGLASGTYILNIIVGDKKQTVKFVKL